jgi:hypothetical protein
LQASLMMINCFLWDKIKKWNSAKCRIFITKKDMRKKKRYEEEIWGQISSSYLFWTFRLWKLYKNGVFWGAYGDLTNDFLYAIIMAHQTKQLIYSITIYIFNIYFNWYFNQPYITKIHQSLRK